MTTIWVTFQVEGWHRWPGAPADCIYLKNEHRHIFHFRVEMQVDHANREVEFHSLKTQCMEVIEECYMESDYGHGKDFLSLSCEDLAMQMLQNLDGEDGRWMACEVSEDGECGARVEARTLSPRKALSSSEQICSICGSAPCENPSACNSRAEEENFNPPEDYDVPF